jgi:hypothetical protein
MPKPYPCCSHCVCSPKRNNHKLPCHLCQDKDS